MSIIDHGHYRQQPPSVRAVAPDGYCVGSPHRGALGPAQSGVVCRFLAGGDVAADLDRQQAETDQRRIRRPASGAQELRRTSTLS